jgi:hypothetical protein
MILPNGVAGKLRPGGQPLPIIPAKITDHLLDCPWVGWILDASPGRAKPAKVPIDPRSGSPASVRDPKTWGDFPAAVIAVERYGLAGVGVVLGRRFQVTGIDLDGCVDPDSSVLNELATAVLEDLPGTYAEFSPSGRGIRAFVLGTLPSNCRNRVGNLEVYSESRYMTVTGNVLPGRPFEVTDAANGLDRLVTTYLRRKTIRLPVAQSSCFPGTDEELLERATANPKTGPRLTTLLRGQLLNHGSRSEADFELCRILGFWSGGDPDRVERIIRTRGTYRPKWDQPRGGISWLTYTILRALAGLKRVYGSRSPQTPKIPKRADKSVSVLIRSPEEQAEAVQDYIRALRLEHGRPVGLSARQASHVIGRSPATAARRLAELVRNGRLIIVSRGSFRSELATEYDLPKFVDQPPAILTRRSQASSKRLIRPNGRLPPYSRTSGGLVAVWKWFARERRWRHFGDCPDQDSANKLADRHMARRSGWCAVGDRLLLYQRGRALHSLDVSKPIHS